MCACICAYVHFYVCVSACICGCMCAYVHACVVVCASGLARDCLLTVLLALSTKYHVCVCICACMCVCMCAYLHAYVVACASGFARGLSIDSASCTVYRINSLVYTGP